MKKVVSIILSLTMVISLCMYAYAKDDKQETNPYVEAYLKELDSNDVNEEILKETIQTLIEYYNSDNCLKETIKGKFEFDCDLITSVKKEDKISAMKVLKEEYNNLGSEVRSLIYNYFKRYVNYTGDEELISFYNDENERQRALNTVNSGFNPTQAATWAYNNGDSIDYSFPYMIYLGGDCTNFVSQALYHGGMTMRGNWYCYKKNSTYLVPSDSYELNYSWSLSDPSPWVSVGEFSSFWLNYCDDYYEYTTSDYISNHTTYFNNPIYLGDVVIFCTQTLWWMSPAHAMIISQYNLSTRDFNLAGHTYNRTDYPLLTAITGYDSVRFYCL